MPPSSLRLPAVCCRPSSQLAVYHLSTIGARASQRALLSGCTGSHLPTWSCASSMDHSFPRFRFFSSATSDSATATAAQQTSTVLSTSSETTTATAAPQSPTEEAHPSNTTTTSASDPSQPTSPPPPATSPPLPSSPLRIRPSLLAVFTCTHCNTRSTHRLSRQAYQHGVVLVRCPGTDCGKLHLMADHLGWFDKKGETIEDIMAEKGMSVGRGVVDVGGSGGGGGGVVVGEGGGVGGGLLVGDEVGGTVGLAVHEHDGVVEILPSAVEEAGSTTTTAPQSHTPETG